MIHFQLSENGKTFIRKQEGLRMNAYLDSGGVPTIGYGHIKDVKMGMKISRREAENFFEEDIAPVQKFVNSLGVCRNVNQFTALCSFAFNLGCGALAGSTLLKLMKLNHPTEEVAKQFGRWVYVTVGAGEKKAKIKKEGLVARREREAELFCKTDSFV